uniref:NADH-ubiquinone oxidoreductase chain 6 n=2 Tax=Coleoptera TaxID=7041 RepID=A0A346RKQ4_9COLE|nr:NADH dehydrogenase subunit 6 [Curculionoidea sp. 9 KM-2017]AXS66651.1 NADH dehydrogenase subunit 6 [Coleoptera sp. 32 KM-2017]
MLMTLSLISWLLAIIFIVLSHPLSLGLMLFFLTIIMSMLTGLFFMNFWFSYILFLIMVGGLLVLLMYMTSVASNEKFKFSFKILLMFSMCLLILFTALLLDDMFNLPLISGADLQLMTQAPMMNIHMNKYFNQPGIPIMFFLMIYLLVTLIIVVKITDFSFGPLRQMF